jgi:hypothetical protein
MPELHVTVAAPLHRFRNQCGRSFPVTKHGSSAALVAPFKPKDADVFHHFVL